MPGFDGNGPMGAGPMTGGTRGRCNLPVTGDIPMTRPAGYGRGMRYGQGFGHSGGFGRRRRCYGRNYSINQPVFTNNSVDELSMLKQQSDSAKARLDLINEKIATLEKND
ncbi:DUF5320 domain-containing protein [Desulfobacterales bacterium HSG16]|nr:DUF5320 domain-containing protein [Desulfobacterales bacterium HSG16]